MIEKEEKQKKTKADIAGERLTAKQKAFVDNLLYNNKDIVTAMEAAGYEVTGEENVRRSNLRMLARSNFASEKVREYMDAVREELSESLGTDKLYVMRKLKELAEFGNESTQLRALENIGKILGLYVEKQEVSVSDSPAQIARDAFKKRMKLFVSEESEDNEETA